MKRSWRTIGRVGLALVAVAGPSARFASAEIDACEQSATNAYRSCKAGAQSDSRLAMGRCANDPDPAAASACSRQAVSDSRDARQECRAMNALRIAVCDRLGPAAYAPAINPADFTTTIDNPYFPLPPGTTYISEGQTADGFEHVEFEVTHNTRVISGVTCVEVHDVRTVNGAVLEDTRDWFAQDLDGNVWYFGENTAIVDGGQALVDGGLPVDLAGTWTAGVDGARPGIAMKAQPAVGDFYRQEYLLGEAEDLAEVKSLTESLTVAGGSCSNNCLKTEESSPLAPGDVESKFYKQSVGLLRTVEPTGEHVDLVQIVVQ